MTSSASALLPEAEIFSHPTIAQAWSRSMPLASYQTSVPVVVDEAKCIADKGCTVCVDVCPLDVLRISDMTGKAFMAYDECWYCMPCEADCPTGAVKVNIPYLVR
jgi:NAD-dependent dihydropyrimidine dehydrogenase PreA subunit